MDDIIPLRGRVANRWHRAWTRSVSMTWSWPPAPPAGTRSGPTHHLDGRSSSFKWTISFLYMDALRIDGAGCGRDQCLRRSCGRWHHPRVHGRVPKIIQIDDILPLRGRVANRWRRTGTQSVFTTWSWPPAPPAGARLCTGNPLDGRCSSFTWTISFLHMDALRIDGSGRGCDQCLRRGRGHRHHPRVRARVLKILWMDDIHILHGRVAN